METRAHLESANRRPGRRRTRAVAALLGAAALSAANAAAASDFQLFETGPVRPLARSGNTIYAVNTPDNQLHIFDLTDNGLIETAQVQVGMEPCAVAVAGDGTVWVVNHLSDSVSIVDPSLSPPQVVRTLLTGDEPRDIVMAGTPERAFVSTAHRGQHRVDASIASVPGAGDPQFTTEGIGRTDVWVFEVGNLGTTFGGTPIEILNFFGDTPRALAVTGALGNRVVVAPFKSGNQTTVLPEGIVCDGFQQGVPCPLGGGVLTVPGGAPGPTDNAAGAPAPEVGLIIKFNNATNRWEDDIGTNFNSVVRFDLPDTDVFEFNANTLNPIRSWDHVGTTIFNMAWNQARQRLYVSNIEAPNHIDFEGAGDHGGSTVQGHLSESRISVLGIGLPADPIHLNKHIDYSKLHTDVPDLVDPTQKNHSLATPLEMVFTADGGTVYVAAFGSAKIGVFDTAALEANTFDPTVTSADYIPTAGGPSGLVLDEVRDWIVVSTRFDNSVSVIDLATKATLQSVALHNPEPQSVIDGRPVLYDAFNFSGNGEASCASCHIFGDMDDLAWNLGDPDGAVTQNTQPSPVGTGVPTLHPMKGPMTTQTLRGMATHGALHWRGDRVDGFFGVDPCTEPTGAACDEEHSFNNFIVAFEGLIGMDGTPTTSEMQQFTDFALQLMLPPNPVRNLDNSLTTAQTRGETAYFQANQDGTASCNTCHLIDAANGFFGTDGGQTAEGLTQNMKIPHTRNAYQKIGMFGMFVNPNITLGAHTGDQIRGFGFLHSGAVDTIQQFLSAPTFTLSTQDERDIEDFTLAFDTDLAPIVGQQVTLDATNGTVVGPRIDLLKARAGTAFASLLLGAGANECDLIVKGTVGGAPRGWLYDPVADDFDDDQGGTITDTALRALATSQGPLTYTCAPPGAGTRMAINRDRDAFLDGNDNCADAANDLQIDTDGDLAGDACDQDDDDDSVLDAYETGTGIFVSAFDTGTDPLDTDSDDDGHLDGDELAAGTDPNDPNDPPTAAVPALPLPGAVALALGVLGGALPLRRPRITPQ